jgi:carboxyl-terminal processing protease
MPSPLLKTATWLGVLAITLLAIAGARAGAPAPAAAAPAADSRRAISWEDARLLAELLQKIRENYVAPVDEHRLMQAAARGMATVLDEHSAFLDRDEFDDMKAETSGTYAGVGVEVEAQENILAIVRCIPGSPADRAGLRPADTIISVDGVAVSGTDMDTAMERMRGDADTTVRLAVRRGDRTLQFDVRRGRVEMASVDGQPLAAGIGYLRISSFTDTTASEFETQLKKLRATGRAPLRGLVIDLRNNPGGVFDAAVDVADDLLDHGRIVSAVGRAPDASFVDDAAPGDISHGAELAVIVNGNSASAAEILAAALQENHRATLIGHRTYGKGTVQSVLPLSDGRAIKLTTSRYYTPSGASLDKRGLTPDIGIDAAEEPAAELDVAGSMPTLATRDALVGIALQTLRLRLAASGSASVPRF